MKEFMNQHGETVLAGTAAALVISSFAGMAFGGGFSRIAHIFSSWLYGLGGSMKKIIQLIGGIFVAAILVIAVTAIYQNKIIPELKTDAFKSAEKKTNFSDEKAFYEAVSYHPVFEYTGGTAQKTAITYNENNQATAPSVKYSVLKDICVTDKKDDYEKTLAEAVEENRIRNIEVTVSTPDKEETSDASYDKENQTITFTKSGIYLVKVTGKDAYNNRTETEFLVPVETQWKSEKNDNW